MGNRTTHHLPFCKTDDKSTVKPQCNENCYNGLTVIVKSMTTNLAFDTVLRIYAYNKFLHITKLVILSHVTYEV